MIPLNKSAYVIPLNNAHMCTCACARVHVRERMCARQVVKDASGVYVSLPLERIPLATLSSHTISIAEIALVRDVRWMFGEAKLYRTFRLR